MISFSVAKQKAIWIIWSSETLHKGREKKDISSINIFIIRWSTFAWSNNKLEEKKACYWEVRDSYPKKKKKKGA